MEATPTPEANTLSMERFFGMRTPMLPYREFLNWGNGLIAASCFGEAKEYKQAYDADRQCLRERLRDLIERPEIREALFLASPDLIDSVPKWIQDPDTEKGQRTELALVRYFGRMCCRPTPFGLFAGYTTGFLGETTRFELPERSSYVRHSRLDMDYLCNLVAELHKNRSLRETLRYWPNSSLYRSAGRLRYAETRMEEDQRKIHLVAVQEDSYLNAILVRAEGGASLQELAESILDDEITRDEAMEFIHELIDTQLLVPNLEPSITGPEPLPELIRTLERSEDTIWISERLQQAGGRLNELDRAIGNSITTYQELAADLETLPGKMERSKLWQVDLFKPSSRVTIGPGMQKELEENVAFLRDIAQVWDMDPFREFKEAFHRRYEERWVPLAEALDPECGLGLSGTSGNTVQASPLLDGLQLGVEAENTLPSLKPREVYLFRRILEMRHKGETVLELQEEDLAALRNPGKTRPLPHSFSCLMKLAATSPEAMSEGDYQVYMQEVSGPSAGRMLGRFCHGDPELTKEITRHLEDEERCHPHAVFAEIVHLPSGRMGNVIARPCLRSYEIPYLGRSGEPQEKQIAFSDLWVGIHENRVVLWSKRLNRQVIPRLSSAANYAFRSNDVYRFLGSLQDQNVHSGFGWTWGALANEPKLPRVVRGKCILHLAVWNLRESDLKPLKEATTPLSRFQAIQEIRGRLELPRFMTFADGDHELPLDLENPLSVEAFWVLVRRYDVISLTEDFPGEDRLVTKGPEGAFTHEISFVFLAPPDQPGSKLEAPDLESRVTRHLPGSSWLFAKLFCGQSTADHVLVDAVAPLVHDLMEQGEIDRWFFIRYSDPEPHLRLRMHGEPHRLWGSVLDRLQQVVAPLMAEGTLWRVQFDAYEPEEGRYGGPENMARAEQIFQMDSEVSLRVLERYPGDGGADARWRLMLKGMDAYFDAAGWTLEQRLEFCQVQRDKLAQEQGVPAKYLKHKLGEKFRSERKALTALLRSNSDHEGVLGDGIRMLESNVQSMRPCFEAMLELERQKKLTHSLDMIMASLVHMSTNRLLRSAQRTQEMVLYDFLFRFHESEVARRKSGVRKDGNPEGGHV